MVKAVAFVKERGRTPILSRPLTIVAVGGGPLVPLVSWALTVRKEARRSGDRANQSNDGTGKTKQKNMETTRRMAGMPRIVGKSSKSSDGMKSKDGSSQ